MALKADVPSVKWKVVVAHRLDFSVKFPAPVLKSSKLKHKMVPQILSYIGEHNYCSLTIWCMQDISCYIELLLGI